MTLFRSSALAAALRTHPVLPGARRLSNGASTKLTLFRSSATVGKSLPREIIMEYLKFGRENCARSRQPFTVASSKTKDTDDDAEVVMDDAIDDTDDSYFRDLLWFPGGVAIGVGLGALSYSLMPLGDQHAQHDWWRCAMVCSSIWLALYTTVTVLLIRCVYMDGEVVWATVARKAGYVWAAMGMLMFTIWGVLANVASDAVGFYPFYFQGTIAAVVAVVLDSILLIRLLVPEQEISTASKFPSPTQALTHPEANPNAIHHSNPNPSRYPSTSRPNTAPDFRRQS